jgi:hypothetical protein
VSVALAHSKLITSAARDALRPLGVFQKGRSRTWLDDQGWWLGVVEFQPSSYGRGTYLNVGVDWLWNPKSYLSFDYGGRVHFHLDGAQNAQFIEYKSDEQFAPLAARLATIAAEELQLYRERFATTNATALVLVDGGRAWFDRGVVLGLAGDAVRSREMFSRHIAQFEEGDVKWRTPSSIRRNDRAIALMEIVGDQDTFRDAIRNDVRTARSMLKLDPAIPLPF